MKKSVVFIGMALFLSTLPLQAQSLKPGIWKAQSSFKLNGLPLPPSEGSECITPLEAKDAKATITKELKRNGCALTSWKIKGAQLEASLVCKSKDLDAEGSLKGSFSEKSYNLSGEANGTYQQMLPTTASLELQGTWMKDCPN